MRDGIGDEIERADSRDPWHNPDLLQAQQEQDRLKTIGELCGQYQRAERRLRRNLPRRHGQCKVPQEHSPAL